MDFFRPGPLVLDAKGKHPSGPMSRDQQEVFLFVVNVISIVFICISLISTVVVLISLCFKERSQHQQRSVSSSPSASSRRSSPTIVGSTSNLISRLSSDSQYYGSNNAVSSQASPTEAATRRTTTSSQDDLRKMLVQLCHYCIRYLLLTEYSTTKEKREIFALSTTSG